MKDEICWLSFITNYSTQSLSRSNCWLSSRTRTLFRIGTSGSRTCSSAASALR